MKKSHPKLKGGSGIDSVDYQYIRRRIEQMTLETMNSRQLEYFRRRLLTWRDELVSESGETACADCKATSIDFKGHAANAANNHTSSQSSQDREQTLIHKIDEALRLIEEGTYGMQTAF
jgi:hypothetical protein